MSSTPRAEADAAPATILVVDDHADTTFILARLLRHDGHRVLTAASYATAMAAARDDPAFDLLICDLRLGDADGCHLLVDLRAARRVPAIAVTGAASADDVRRTRQAGFDAHLTKPIDYARLRELVAALLAARPAAPRREPGHGHS